MVKIFRLKNIFRRMLSSSTTDVVPLPRWGRLTKADIYRLK